MRPAWCVPVHSTPFDLHCILNSLTLIPLPAPSSTVNFPHPSSPLLDLQVIIGDDSKLAALVAAFEAEVTRKEFTLWPALDWLTKE